MRRSFLASPLSAVAMLLMLQGAALARSPTPAPQAITDDAEGDNSAPTIIATGWDMSRRITLPIHIDGKGPFNFVVDTGSERTVISRELASKLALAPDDPVRINSIAGITQVNTVTIPRLSYGRGMMPSVQAPVLEAINLGAPGLLGLDGLASKRLTIDFRKQTMEVSDSGERVAIDSDAIIVHARRRSGQLILVDSQANGEKINVILDTGSDRSIGNLALLRTLTHERKIEALRPIEIISVTGDRIMGGWNLVDKVQIGGFSITNLPVVFADVSPFHQLHLDNKPALLLGMDVLQRFDRIAVDFGRKRVHFLLPDSVAAESPRLASR